MFKEIRLNCEIAVIGAGPAGIAAATVAAQGGRSVILLDDNTHSGGQIWRGENAHSKRSTATEWLQRLNRTSAQQLFRARVFHANDRTLFAESPEHVFQVSFEKLILATGARERFLCFPGWTLPGVFGAGGLQALSLRKRKRCADCLHRGADLLDTLCTFRTIRAPFYAQIARRNRPSLETPWHSSLEECLARRCGWRQNHPRSSDFTQGQNNRDPLRLPRLWISSRPVP